MIYQLISLSSLKCEMNGTLQGRGGLYIVIWIPNLDPDSRYRPTKTISPAGKGREHAPGLSVCLYGLSVCDPACLLGVLGLVVVLS